MSAAKQNAFMLSSATLMVNKFGDTVSVFDLNPADHSVGLAKEIAVVVDSSNLDLTAGIAQALVDSKRTNVQSSITGSVQEYSADNLLRAQGLATAARQPLRGKLHTEAAAAAASLVIDDDPIPGDASSSLGAAAGAIKAGDTLLVQHPTIDGYVFPCRAAADSTYAAPSHTVSIAGCEIPAGMDFPVGASVWVVTEMEAGSTDQGDLFSVKVVGTLANFNRPVVYVAPKVQVTKGFNISFRETQYGAMPWEMRALLLSASEATGRLAEIGTKAAGRLYAA